MAETRDRSDRDRGDRDRDIAVRPHHQLQVHSQKGGGTLSYGRGAATGSGRGPTASQVIAVVTLVPIGGILLCLAGFTLLGSLIGLAVATPLFILFSPVLVPAIILIALAVTGFLSSGAFGLTGLSSLSWVAGYLKQASQRVPEDLDYAKKRMADVAAYAGQKTKEAGHTVESKAKETGTGTTTSTGTTGRT